MQNLPRLFINQNLSVGKIIDADKNIIHYLQHVMRRNECLVFNDGIEYNAVVSDDNKHLVVGEKTSHVDPSGNLTLCFVPIKKIDELVNMATQMGVGCLQPVITERCVANHVNWERVRRIIIEASEQSNRNSVPKLMEPIKFEDLDLKNLVVADERFAHGKETTNQNVVAERVLVGPEGGFSNAEFEQMDSAKVVGLSLGKTVLRAEVAAVVAISKVLNK